MEACKIKKTINIKEIKLIHKNKTRHNDHKIKDIPQIPQISLIIEQKSKSEYLNRHFHCVYDNKSILERNVPISISQRIIQSHRNGVKNNNEQNKALKQIMLDYGLTQQGYFPI